MLTRRRIQHRRLVLVVFLMRQNNILRTIVGTTRAEHETIDTHAYVVALGFDALPHEHAGSFDPIHPAWLRAYLIGWNWREVAMSLKVAVCARARYSPCRRCVECWDSMGVADHKSMAPSTAIQSILRPENEKRFWTTSTCKFFEND